MTLFSKTHQSSEPSDFIERNEEISVKQMTDKRKSPAIFQRIACADMNAVRECLDYYGNLVWAAARKYTASTEETETATEGIFLWQSESMPTVLIRQSTTKLILFCSSLAAGC